MENTLERAAIAGRGFGDRWRQIAVLVLSVSMPVTTVLAFATGTSFEEATRSDVGRPLIEPAGYAFVIWTLIYAGSVVYGAFQALPSQAGNPLFRQIGGPSASAFLATSLWLVMARYRLIWLTVACIVWMLFSLVPVFVRLVRCYTALTPAERLLVRFPLSVFTGWVTVATFANTAAALKESGWLSTGLSEEAWTILLLVTAGLLACSATVFSRGDLAYALTIVWVMAAITVANAGPGGSTPVAVTAGVVGLVAILALAASRLFRPERPTSPANQPASP